MSNRGVFIDFDGTLCHDRFWRSLDPETFQRIQTFFHGNRDIIPDWMRGKYTSEQINRLIAESLRIDFDFLWHIFVKDCKSMSIETVAFDHISELRNSYTTILCTDNMDCFGRFTIPALELKGRFDAIINSYEEKLSKNDNDGELFKRISERFHIDITKSILIDNSEKTCEIFRRLGGRSFLVTEDRPLTYWLQSVDKTIVRGTLV